MSIRSLYLRGHSLRFRAKSIASAVVVLSMLATNVEAATYYWVGTGSADRWEDSSNWSTVTKGGAGGSHVVPTVLDNAVMVSSGTTVRIRSAAKVRSLTMTNTWSGSLLMGTGSLQVGSGANVTGVQVRIGSGKLIGGTGNISVAGNYTQTGGLVSAQGTLSVSGSLFLANVLTNFTSTGTIALTGSGNQTLTLGTAPRVLKLNNLTLRNAGQSTTNSIIVASGSLNLSGALTINQGKLDLATNSKNLNYRNGLTIGSNARASLSTNSNVTSSGTISVNSAGGGLSVTAGTWTLQTKGNVSHDFGGFKVVNLTVNNTGVADSNVVTITGNPLNVSGALTVTQGQLNLATASMALAVRSGITVGSNSLASLKTNSNIALSGSLTVNSAGGGLSVTAGILTLNGSGTQTISLGGNRLYSMTINNNVNSSTQNTVVVSGSDLLLSGSLIITKGRLNLNGQTLNADGSVTLANSSLVTLSGSSMNIGGNLTVNGSSTFTHPYGTVTLDGSNQTLSGSISFYNLIKSPVGSDTLSLSAGKTITVAGGLTWVGPSCTSKLAVRSTDTGIQWKINPTGSTNLTFVDLKDGNNTRVQLLLANGADSGNTTNMGIETCATSSSSGGTDSNTGSGGGGGGGGRGGGGSAATKTISSKTLAPKLKPGQASPKLIKMVPAKPTIVKTPVNIKAAADKIKAAAAARVAARKAKLAGKKH